jgi:NADPH:quinone reductase-like Zn-dependent oxidoreductase
VTGVRIGDEVFGAAQHATAERAVLDVWHPKPAAMSWAEAGALSMAVETATRGLDLLGLSAGETLLVNGAAGGVGLSAVQLALGRGLVVVGTCGPGNVEHLQGLGARATTYGPGLAERLASLEIGTVDGALDVAGVDALRELLALTGSPERVVSIGDGTAPALGIRFTTGAEGRAFHGLAEAAALAEEGRFRLPVAGAWPLEQAAEAHRASERGHVLGKYVVLVHPTT